jgi:hypothetical protein
VSVSVTNSASLPLPPGEREIMLERQREGIAKAKSEGKYSDAYEVKRVARLIGPAAVAKQLGIARSTVYRLLERPARTKQNWQTGSSFMPLVLSYRTLILMVELIETDVAAIIILAAWVLRAPAIARE